MIDSDADKRSLQMLIDLLLLQNDQLLARVENLEQICGVTGAEDNPTVKQAAHELGFKSVQRVYQLVAEGRLVATPKMRDGLQRITRESIEKVSLENLQAHGSKRRRKGKSP